MKAFKYITLLLCVLLLFAGCAPKEALAHPMEIYFLDVGQGDATLIRTREGDVLIDAGSEGSQEALCLRLQELGITSLRLLILSHPDEDHIGGADGILRAFPTEEVWVNGMDGKNESYEALKAALAEQGMEATAVGVGKKCLLGELSFFILAPLSMPTEGNEGSLILKVTFGEISMLFSGDAEEEGEAELLSRYGKDFLSCNLYKVAHHGSYTSTSEALLAAMSPHYAVISSGAGNSYGHPHGEILARLERAGCEILRTDVSGELRFWSDGTTLERMQ